MTSKLSVSAIGLLALGMIIAGSLANYYHAQLTKSQASLIELNRELKLAKDGIADMQRRQHDVAALDAKYTKELVDARKNIAQLEHDVATGRKRLQLSATCAARGAPGSSGMDDGATPRLTHSAERDYLTLRERIETSRSMILGLQQYITEQCLK
ncbi:lysis protein [Cronobacter dublinensis]|uniref:lysis protein n=1 Tax=Cronobacter dublinensis TaxID=413497 RepID=UPI002896021F|nr:lysis protein [Cronobacter dublinensis]MDT3604176.1 lysis protein [Cronobacter dublinensis]